MATTTRYSVAKTQKSYDPVGVGAVLGSTVKSEIEQWKGGALMATCCGSVSTDRVPPTS